MQKRLSEKPTLAKAWAVALRPASLPLAVGPVVAGASLGYLHSGNISLLLGCMALMAAVLMQVITNLQNDIGFTARGCERVGQHTGLPRATAEQWLSLRAVRLAIVVLCALATALGLAIVTYRGWPVLLMGTTSLLAALAYMGGPKPIAYTPFGEATVVVFFGLVAVMGTEWLVTGSIYPASAVAAIAIGCLSAAALAVNNHRDVAHDRLMGRQTFAVRFGRRKSSLLLAGLLACPFVMCVVLSWLDRAPLLLAPLALAALPVNVHRDFRTCETGAAYNAVLFRVFRLELWFATLLSSAAVLTRVLQ